MQGYRTADGVPEKVKELLENYSMEIFVEQMRPKRFQYASKYFKMSPT
ncbi:hypothetical protein [Paenibacillus jiagnxiensis]